MEGSSVKSSASVQRKREVNKHAWDDILYLLMGDATPGNALVLVLAIIFFGITPFLLFMLFASYSGGMRWLVTLAIVTFLGFLAAYLMKRGTRKPPSYDEKKEVKTEFPGELSKVTEAVDRGAAGYVYSQQMIRERLCEDIINKLAIARDLSEDQVISRLEKNDIEFVNDEILARFLLKNHRGGKGWEESLGGKGKSEERGKKFMMEIEVILDRIEEIV